MRIENIILSFLVAITMVQEDAFADNGKILIGSHIGGATILRTEGINSDKAKVWFRRELEDEIETCQREKGEDAGPAEVARCAAAGLKHTRGAVQTRRAFCSRSTIYTEFGNFSMINTEKEPEVVIGGKRSQPVRTDWKDHRSGKIVGNCGGCNTPQILDTFKILCPTFYDAMFRGLEPY